MSTPSQPGTVDPDPGLDPGALTTALVVLGVIFAIIIVAFVGLYLVRLFRVMRGKNRKLKRRAERRRSQ